MESVCSEPPTKLNVIKIKDAPSGNFYFLGTATIRNNAKELIRSEMAFRQFIININFNFPEAFNENSVMHSWELA